ncbi:Uncharacterised protein [Vibrio cholerae]|nr:Uncharacterised protein [Vibrio cholerae]
MPQALGYWWRLTWAGQSLPLTLSSALLLVSRAFLSVQKRSIGAQ